MAALEGVEIPVHVNDPGRLKELLFPGAEVYLRYSAAPGRKTDHTLVAVRDEGMLVSVDSLLPNTFIGGLLGTERWLPYRAADGIRREVPVGRSRLDFSFHMGGREWYAEVKGCTLVREGRALFPDAPTSRGERHVLELARLAEEGFRTAVFVVIQRPDARVFSPNRETDPDFARALEEAVSRGVVVHALTTRLVPGLGLLFEKEVSVEV